MLRGNYRASALTEKMRGSLLPMLMLDRGHCSLTGIVSFGVLTCQTMFSNVSWTI